MGWIGLTARFYSLQNDRKYGGGDRLSSCVASHGPVTKATGNRLTSGSQYEASHPLCDSPNAPRCFTLGASNICFVGENPTRVVPALQRCLWSYDNVTTVMFDMSTPPPPTAVGAICRATLAALQSPAVSLTALDDPRADLPRNLL